MKIFSILMICAVTCALIIQGYYSLKCIFKLFQHWQADIKEFKRIVNIVKDLKLEKYNLHSNIWVYLNYFGLNVTPYGLGFENHSIGIYVKSLKEPHWLDRINATVWYEDNRIKIIGTKKVRTIKRYVYIYQNFAKLYAHTDFHDLKTIFYRKIKRFFSKNLKTLFSVCN